MKILNLFCQFVLIFVLVRDAIAQFDLCIFFGTCNNNNNNRNINSNNFNARNDPGPESITVDGDWVEPKNSAGNVLYHFGNEVGPSDWYSADSYCSEKGGYLAEPSSDEEQNFIVGYARFGDWHSYFLGLC
jgi:hypothetical protein